MISVMAASLHRDLLLVMRRKSEVFTALFFFVIVASLFPLGIGPDPGLLRKIAPGVIWVSALLATLLGLQRMLASDYADGTLEQMALSPASLSAMVAGKILAHWLVCGLPLVVLAPVIGLQFDLGASAIGLIVLTLLLGTPTLSMIGAVGASLTLGARGGGALLSLLVLPLYIPVLIFGAGAVNAHLAGLGAEGHLSLLAALFIFAAVFAPWVAAVSIRISLE
jgi:heme exporter protein B